MLEMELYQYWSSRSCRHAGMQKGLSPSPNHNFPGEWSWGAAAGVPHQLPIRKITPSISGDRLLRSQPSWLIASCIPDRLLQNSSVKIALRYDRAVVSGGHGDFLWRYPLLHSFVEDYYCKTVLPGPASCEANFSVLFTRIGHPANQKT